MLKKTVTYTPFDFDETGNVQPVTEDLFFNLTQAECIELDMAAEGHLKERLERVGRGGTGRQIIETFKAIVMKAYGEKTDGGGFAKSEAISNAFAGTPAYDAFFTELIADPDFAALFVKKVIPENLGETLLNRPGVAKGPQPGIPGAPNREQRRAAERKKVPLKDLQGQSEELQPVNVGEETILSRPPHEPR